jgi:hypothetical protein
MNLAFKRYYQKHIIDGKNYKDFFNPSNNVKTLTSIGSDNMLGVRRTPHFSASPDVLKDIRLIAWKAVQQWQINARISKFGENYMIKTKQVSVWIPDSVVWLYREMERKKQDKLASSSSISETNSSVFTVPSVVSLSSLPARKNANNLINKNDDDKVCFYGHKVSSSTDYRGRQSWRVSPTPPWPSVPPDRPLCQKCFLFHYNAALKGKSQYDFPQLYLYQKQNVNPINSGGASSSTERPPG